MLLSLAAQLTSSVSRTHRVLLEGVKSVIDDRTEVLVTYTHTEMPLGTSTRNRESCGMLQVGCNSSLQRSPLLHPCEVSCTKPRRERISLVGPPCYRWSQKDSNPMSAHPFTTIGWVPTRYMRHSGLMTRPKPSQSNIRAYGDLPPSPTGDVRPLYPRRFFWPHGCVQRHPLNVVEV